MRVGTALLFAIFCGGCKAIVIDTSMQAIAANDKTLIHSACHAAPGQGLDVCRVVEGAPIEQKWVMVVPHAPKFIAGEIRVRYKDVVKTYPVTSDVVIVPWKDFIGHETWQLDDEAPAQALGVFRYEGETGEVFVDVLGMAYLIVLQKGYSPMPIDSGLSAWKTKCEIAYSTAGRSAIRCSE